MKFLIEFSPTSSRNEDPKGRPVQSHTMQDGSTVRVLESGYAEAALAEAPRRLWQDPNVEGMTASYVACNAAQSELELMRSPLCGTPIYYCLTDAGVFLCASHVMLLNGAGMPLTENQDVLPEYFCYRCVAAPNTLYAGIRQLVSGERMTVRFLNGKCELQTVQTFLPRMPARRVSVSDAARSLNDALDDCMRRLGVSGEGTSLLFSGGLDSSIVLQLGKRFGLRKTFSSSYPFDAPSNDKEKLYAESAAAAIGVDHRHCAPADVTTYLRCIIKSIAHAEQPVHHLQSGLVEHLYGTVRTPEMSMGLVGLGAGGCFGNFRNHLFWLDKPIIKGCARLGLRGLLESCHSVSGRFGDVLTAMDCLTADVQLASPEHPLWSWHAHGDRDWICRTFGVTRQALMRDHYAIMQHYEGRSMYDIWALYSLLIDEAATYSIWSQIAQGNGIALYSPFYDTEVLNSAFSLAWSVKLNAPKNCIRKEMARQLEVPRWMVQRSKSGFGPGDASWRRRDGVFSPLMKVAGKGLAFDHLDAPEGNELGSAFIRWCLMNYGIWRRLFICGEGLHELLTELDAAMLEDSEKAAR